MEIVLTLGRTTTISRGMSLSTIVGEISTLTVCNAGEALKKSSRYEVLHSLAEHADSSNVVRFGKMKWLKKEGVVVWRTNFSRLVEPSRRGSEEGVATLG